MHNHLCILLQAKHLEFVSGVNATSYWLSTALWDVLNALVPVLVSTAIFYAFQLDAYSGKGLLAVFLLLVRIKCSSIDQYGVAVLLVHIFMVH